MGRIIVTLALLVVVVVFIGLNLPYRTTVDLFGWRIEDAPSVIVILASIILGILLSLSVYFLSFLSRRRRRLMQKRIDELSARDVAQDRAAPQLPTDAPPQQPTDAGTPAPQAAAAPAARARRRKR